MEALTRKEKDILAMAEANVAHAEEKLELLKIIQRLSDELKHYKDLEKQGRSITLPCKTEDPIFIIAGGKDGRNLNYRVVELHIDHFTIGSSLIPMITACDDENEWYELMKLAAHTPSIGAKRFRRG